MTELIKCECGGEPIIQNPFHTYKQIECQCGKKTEMYLLTAEAIEAWNRRSKDE